jgi:hypothetical protein
VFDELDSTPGGAKDIVNRAYANFGKAIAAYERLLVSNNFEASPFESLHERRQGGDVAGRHPGRAPVRRSRGLRRVPPGGDAQRFLVSQRGARRRRAST